MRILFENYALEATVTSTNASTNYPPTNLTHPFLRKRYQNLDGSDTITVLFESDKTINSLYFGYHNADEEELLLENGDILTTEQDDPLLVTTAKITYNVYNLGGTLLLSGSVDMVNQFEAVHFTDIQFVRRVTIVIEWDGLGKMGYLGGIGIGRSYIMPYFNTGWQNGMLDNTVVNRSLVGQVLQNYIEPQDTKTFNWTGVRPEAFTEIKLLVKSTGIGRPVWVDFFEESHETIAPIYATINGIEGAQKTEGTYNMSMTFTEAR